MFWHARHNPGGLFDLRIMRDVAVMTGAGVGGGSLVYANVQLRAPDDVFDDPAWPAAIDALGLRPYYDRTEAALDPRRRPPSRRCRRSARSTRWPRTPASPPQRLPIAVHFGADRRHPFSGVHQQGCDNLGRCDIGCPRMPKNTVDITYVARAEQHGAEVFPLHEVVRIDPPARDGEHWTVGFRDLQYGIDGEVSAPVLVLAAGTLGSTRLLLKNRKRAAAPVARARHALLRQRRRARRSRSTRRQPDVEGARADFGPTMTSRIDLSAEQQLMVADGGLPDELRRAAADRPRHPRDHRPRPRRPAGEEPRREGRPLRPPGHAPQHHAAQACRRSATRSSS